MSDPKNVPHHVRSLRTDYSVKCLNSIGRATKRLKSEIIQFSKRTKAHIPRVNASQDGGPISKLGTIGPDENDLPICYFLPMCVVGEGIAKSSEPISIFNQHKFQLSCFFNARRNPPTHETHRVALTQFVHNLFPFSEIPSDGLCSLFF